MAGVLIHGRYPRPFDRSSVAAARIFDVPLSAVTKCEALQSLQNLLEAADTGTPRWVAFLNANSFRWTRVDPEYRNALFEATAVYPDGVALGVAAKLARARIRENLPGTDLVPELLQRTVDRGFRCYLLGGTAHDVAAAARHVQRRFPGWRVVGAAAGYFTSTEAEADVVRSIATARPDLLLIGMGTPLQEHFIARHGSRLNARLTICVGGLFAYWSGALVRAPKRVQALRLEWLWILAQQPHKWRRYSVEIASFFGSVIRLRLTTIAPLR